MVDGSSVSRVILARILRDELNNVEVVACESGSDALEHLKKQHFDLVTTALLLSDMDGLALSREIRNTKKHHYTPVIVVSGDADIRLLKEGFEAGVTDYFDKSNGYKALGDFIKSFILRNTGLVGHVLYVEDSRTSAAVTGKTLEKHGLKVTLTDNAEQAIVMLDNQNDEFQFDMVITDFYLEGKLTGGDLLHAIRTRLQLSQQEMPVLVLTSYDDQQKQIEVFHAGGNDFVGKPIIEEILIARVRSLLLIKHQYDALKQQTETMRWIAATDSLTGVRNKRYLVDNGEGYIRHSDNQPVWAMLIDIDHFKQINDNVGHIAGDHVLAEMGETLNLRFPDDMVVRFGGEEFCVLVKNHQADQMLEQAEQLRHQIENLKPAGVDITISIGLAGREDHPGSSLSEFLSKADKALYFSKQRGRNRTSIFTTEGVQESPWNHSRD